MADNKIQVLLTVDDKGTASLQKFGRTVQTLGNTAGSSFGQVQTASAKTATSIGTMDTAATKLGTTLTGSVTKALGAMGTALAAVSVAGFAKSVLDTTIHLDSMSRAMTAVYGSSQAAAAEMEFLRETAGRTGQNVFATVDSFNKFSASAKDTALEGEGVRKVFSAMSEAGAVLGLRNDQMALSFNAFSQMAAKGTVSMEELRQQLGDHLPGAVNIAAKAMSMTTAEFMAAVKAGDILAKDLLPKMADELHNLYGVAAETSALESGQAAVNRLSQAWTEFKANIVDVSAIVSAINFVAGALNGLSTALNRAKQQAADEVAAMGREVDVTRLEMFANRVTWLQAEIAKINRTPIEIQTPTQIKYLEELNAELGQTKKGLDIIGGSKAATKELFDEFDTGFQNVQTVNGAFGETPPILDSVSESALGVAEAYGKQDAALGSLAPRVNDAIFAGEKLSLAELDLSRKTDDEAKKTKEAASAAKLAAKEKKEAEKASKAAARAAKEFAREQEALARETEEVGRAMIEARAKTQAATRELSENLRKSLGEQIREEYAATAAGYDAREKLAEEHAEWIKGLQDGLLRDIENGIGDFVYNFLTGEFDSIGDLFKDLCSSILRAFANLIAEMVAKWAMSGLVGLFTGQGFSGFNVGALGFGQGGLLSGIGSGSGTGTAALSQYGPYAAGYQFGPGAGTSAAVTGGQAAGAALGAAGGAYGLYSAASQASKGEAGVGTALQAGISAYALYKAYPTIAAYLSGLGGASTASTAASGITIAASDLTLIGPQTGGIGNAIAGGGAGAGLSTGAMVGGGAIMGIGALIAMGMGGKAQQEFYSPRYGNVPFNDYGHDDRADMIRAGRSGYNWVSEAQPGSMSGSGDAGITQTGADLERAFKQFESNTRIVLDVLAAAGDGVASLGQQLEDGTLSTDAFVDAIAGYDVSIQDTANLTSLASDAARGNGNAMDSLRAALQSMGLGADQAEVAALALVAASNNQSSALYAASSAASGAASAISGMVSNINTLSRTPLNIRVNVGVREQPYRIDNSNPYAEHAAGGIFAGPTLIPSIRGTRHLVGEAGAEAIMPLHAGPKTLEKMHDDIRALAARPMTTIINLDGQQIARATMPYVDAHVAAKASRGQLANQTRF